MQITIDADKVRYDASSDGCFPLISNDHHLTDAEVLTAYRYQPNLEKRHHQLKSVHDAAPVTFHSSRPSSMNTSSMTIRRSPNSRAHTLMPRTSFRLLDFQPSNSGKR